MEKKSEKLSKREREAVALVIEAIEDHGMPLGAVPIVWLVARDNGGRKHYHVRKEKNANTRLKHVLFQARLKLALLGIAFDRTSKLGAKNVATYGFKTEKDFDDCKRFIEASEQQEAA